MDQGIQYNDTWDDSLDRRSHSTLVLSHIVIMQCPYVYCCDAVGMARMPFSFLLGTLSLNGI